MKKDNIPALSMVFMLIVSHLIAILLSAPFRAQGMQAFENPEDPTNPLLYVVLIILFTALILLIVKFGKEKLIKHLMMGAMGLSLFFILIIPYVYIIFYTAGNIPYLGEIALLLSLATAGSLIFALYKYPEWYVVDIVGVAVAAGVVAIFGISLAILPAIVLLIALAVYDAISVYRTKHMITLADAVTEMRVPALLVVPREKDYSFLEQKPLREELESGEKRDAMFMGLGDIIIPGVLVVSAFSFLPMEYVSGIPSNLIVSMFTLVGIVIGFSILMRYVAKGNPQAGLPLLNSGALIGYALSYLVVYQDLTFGISLNW